MNRRLFFVSDSCASLFVVVSCRNGGSMGRFEKLLQRATETPENLRFSDLCTLAEMAGFQFDRAAGSHKIYKHPAGGMMNFQDVSGKAKPYQVKQLLDYIQRNSGE